MKSCIILVFLFFAGHQSLANDQRCTWVKKNEIINYLPKIIELEESLKDWDTNCKAENPTREYMKKCWCDTNRTALVELKQRISDFENAFPELKEKKVCYKENTDTSRNIDFTSARKFFKRCHI